MIWALISVSVEKMIAACSYLLKVVQGEMFKLCRIVVEYRSCEGIVHDSR